MINSELECQNLIQTIKLAVTADVRFLISPEEQYRQRNNYKEILNHVMNTNELYHLYDIWGVYARTKDVVARGFFLDLWDLYQIEAEADSHKTYDRNQRETDILQCFVCQINNQFDILFKEDISTPKLWRDCIREIVSELINSNASREENRLKRNLLYSMSDLYAYLYPVETIAAEEEKDSFIAQLEITERAILCRANNLKAKIVLNLKDVFEDSNKNDLQNEFIKSFLYLHRFINQKEIGIKELTGTTINHLKQEGFIKEIGQKEGENLLDLLLRYWAATVSLMNSFLEERFKFKFDEYRANATIKFPSPYGTDNYVYTIGASGSGKTYLFHGMEFMTNKKGQKNIPLSIKYVDFLPENQLSRQRWQQGEELEIEQSHLLYMRSKVRNLCRFTFYEIQDSQILQTDALGKWISLPGYFERHLPCAIILMFSGEGEDRLKSYDYLVNLLVKLRQERDDRYRNIPIYFVFNKADRIIEEIKTSEAEKCDRELLERFENYLNCNVEINENFKFFSCRDREQIKSVDELLDLLNRTKSCCQNLTFLNRLNLDINRVKNIVASLLEKNFTNLNFMYTCCLFAENRQYISLENLWQDISNFIIRATRDDLEKYYKRKFQKNIEIDFTKVKAFGNSAAIKKAVMEPQKIKDILAEMNKEPDKYRTRDDFNTFLEIVRNQGKILEKDINIFNNLSCFKETQNALQEFLKQQEFFNRELEKMLRFNLKELGVPIEKGQIEKIEIEDPDFFKDCLITEIKSIDSGDIKYYNDSWKFSGNEKIIDKYKEEKYIKIKDEIKKIVFENIKEYNSKTGSQEQIKIDTENELERIIESLPTNIKDIDLANRNKAFQVPLRDKTLFSNALKIKSAICQVQCGQEREKFKNFHRGKDDLQQTVFKLICELNNPEDAKLYCELLSNYLPKFPNQARYPQFLLIKKDANNIIEVEIDEVKYSVIFKLKNQLEEQQNLLLETTEILLKNLKQYKDITENKHITSKYEKFVINSYKKEYLLKMLAGEDFLVEKFKENPEKIIGEVNNVKNELIDAIVKAGSDPLKIDLEKYREYYKQIKLGGYLGFLNVRDIIDRKDEIELELKTVHDIYIQIWNSIEKNREWLNSDNKIEDLTFINSNLYREKLEKYEKRRKLLIIQERIQFLKQSEWIEDLEWLKDRIQAYTNLDWYTINDFNNERIERLKTDFINDISELLEKELFSTSKKDSFADRD